MCALLMHGVFVALHLLSLQYPSFDIQFLFRSVDLLHFISLLLRILGRKIFFFIEFSSYFSRIHPFSNNLLFVCFFIIDFFFSNILSPLFSRVFFFLQSLFFWNYSFKQFSWLIQFDLNKTQSKSWDKNKKKLFVNIKNQFVQTIQSECSVVFFIIKTKK